MSVLFGLDISFCENIQKSAFFYYTTSGVIRAKELKVYIIPALTNSLVATATTDNQSKLLDKTLRKILRKTFGLTGSCNVEPVRELLAIPNIPMCLCKNSVTAFTKWCSLPTTRLIRSTLDASNPEVPQSLAWQKQKLESTLGLTVQGLNLRSTQGARALENSLTHNFTLLECSKKTTDVWNVLFPPKLPDKEKTKSALRRSVPHCYFNKLAKLVCCDYSLAAYKPFYHGNNATCKLCGHGCEDLEHILCKCPKLRKYRVPKFCGVGFEDIVKSVAAPGQGVEVLEYVDTLIKARHAEHAKLAGSEPVANLKLPFGKNLVNFVVSFYDPIKKKTLLGRVSKYNPLKNKHTLQPISREAVVGEDVIVDGKNCCHFRGYRVLNDYHYDINRELSILCPVTKHITLSTSIPAASGGANDLGRCPRRPQNTSLRREDRNNDGVPI